MYIKVIVKSMATLVAMLVLIPFLRGQTLKGEPIQLKYSFEGFDYGSRHWMSADGSTIIVIDYDVTRTFKWNNNNWVEKPPIHNKYWIKFAISDDGLTIMASLKINQTTGESKLYTYYFKNDQWTLGVSPEINVPNDLSYQGGPGICLSGDGKYATIINCDKTVDSQTCDVYCFRYENGIWLKEFQSNIGRKSNHVCQMDYEGNTILISSDSRGNLFKKSDKQWKAIIPKLNSGYEFYRTILQVTPDGGHMYDFYSGLDFDSLLIRKSKITDKEIIKMATYQLPEFSELIFNHNVSVLSPTGQCFAARDYFDNDYNRLRLFRFNGKDYEEVSTNLQSEDINYSFGDGVRLSADCNTLSVGIRPKSFQYDPLGIGSQIRVYDISGLPTGAENIISEKNDVAIFPNPTCGVIRVPDGWLIESVFDIMGRVMNFNASSNQLELLPSGVYLIQLRNTQGVMTIAKVVKM
jgi:hypothetical protein